MQFKLVSLISAVILSLSVVVAAVPCELSFRQYTVQYSAHSLSTSFVT